MSETITTNADGTIDRATLLQFLADARLAYHTLMTGGKPVSLTYDMGAGKKTVAYSPANLGSLNEYIASLERQLGVSGGRRAIGVRFGGHGGHHPW